MNYTRCTWVDCRAPAKHPQLNKQGLPWAKLCDEHHVGMAEAVAAGIKPMLAAWVKAQGGAADATKRMEGSIKTGALLLGALARLQK